MAAIPIGSLVFFLSTSDPLQFYTPDGVQITSLPITSPTFSTGTPLPGTQFAGLTSPTRYALVSNSQLQIYGKDFDELGSVAPTASSVGVGPYLGASLTDWFVGVWHNTGPVSLIEEYQATSATLLNTVTRNPATGSDRLTQLAISPDGATGYGVGPATADAGINTVNLTTGSWSQLINTSPAPAQSYVRGIVVLTGSGRLVTLQEFSATGSAPYQLELRVYNPDGSSFATWPLGTPGQYIADSLSLGVDDTSVWASGDIGTSPFTVHVWNVQLSDGTILHEFEGDRFSPFYGPFTVVREAISTPVPPPPPTTLETRAIRRMRRFQLAYDENLYLTIRRIELVLQMGVGLSTGQGSEPLIMVRLSKDGGHTWGNERQLSIGAMGHYGARAFAWNLGRARNPVLEITASDPVFTALVDGLMTVDAGTS